MKYSASSTVVLALLMPFAAAHSEALKECDDDLKPTKTVSPRLSNFAPFEGSASLEVVVLPTGTIGSVNVLSSEWKPVGRHGSTKMADKIVSDAVLEWTYPKINEKCLKIVPIRITFE